MSIDPYPMHNLHQRLLAVLQRLNDIDTRSASQQSLSSFIAHIDVESIPILLDCLCKGFCKTISLCLCVVDRFCFPIHEVFVDFFGRWTTSEAYGQGHHRWAIRAI